MSDFAKISTIINSLTCCALGDIKKASSGGSKMGAFILCSCLIDAMAGFVKGADTIHTDFKNFVRDYLPSYRPNELYHDLRCKLVHSYSEGGSYLFTDAKGHLHLQNSFVGRVERRETRLGKKSVGSKSTTRPTQGK